MKIEVASDFIQWNMVLYTYMDIHPFTNTKLKQQYFGLNAFDHDMQNFACLLLRNFRKFFL